VFVAFGLISLREGEPRAARGSFALAPVIGLVRWATRRSPAARRVMLRVNDAFYGQKLLSIDKINR